MLTHDDYQFGGSSLHGDIVPVGSFEPKLLVENFFGVAGEAHLFGETGGRQLVCDYTLSGFEDTETLKSLLDEIDSNVGRLTGDLTIEVNISATYRYSTFLGLERAAMFYDGSGINNWCVHGRLHWRQRKA